MEKGTDMNKQILQPKVILPALVALFVCGNSYAVKVQESASASDTSANQAQTATTKIKSADTRQVATGGDNGVGEVSTGGDNGVGEVSTGGDNGVGEVSTGGDNGVGEMPPEVRKIPEKRANP
jgi:hypothetical protein